MRVMQGVISTILARIAFDFQSLEQNTFLARCSIFVYPMDSFGWTRSSVGLERRTTDAKVTGSNPVGSAISN